MFKRFLLVGTLGLFFAACSQDTKSGETFIPGEAASMQRAETLATTHVAQNPAAFVGIDALLPTRVQIDPRGKAHTFLAQSVKGIPVFGAAGILHFNADGSFHSMTDKFARNVRVDTQADLTASEATEIAVQAHGGWQTVTGAPTAELQVLFHEGQSTLTYLVRIQQFEAGFDPARPVVFIDADSGANVWEYDSLPHQFDTPNTAASSPATYDMNGGTTEPAYDSATLSSEGDQVAEDAHNHSALSLAYLDAAHGRASFDGNGAQVLNYVHYGFRYLNAFWDGTRLTFGDGDNNSDPLVSLDIVAHELGHGVMEHTANLIYANESGALNEANSDILAAATEAYQYGYDTSSAAAYADTWMIGEDVWKKDPDRKDNRPAALRYMDDPALAGDYDYYPDRYTGTSDNGGVHGNSGIANLWFYMLAEGGTHPRGKSTTLVAGIGVEAAAAIWYGAITSYMIAWSNFADARVATLASAADYDAANGTNYAASVLDAWTAVGVTHEPLAYYDTGLGQPLDSLAELSVAHFGPFPAGNYDAIRFILDGVNATGDGDMYVKFGAAPTLTDYDCISGNWGTLEMCEFAPAASGDYYVMVQAWGDAETSPGAVTNATLSVLAVDAPVCLPVAEVCNDGVDNDCDGQSDCSDSDCDADAACQTVCLGDPAGTPGTSCSSASECCSGTCKGKPGSRTCK